MQRSKFNDSQIRNALKPIHTDLDVPDKYREPIMSPNTSDSCGAKYNSLGDYRTQTSQEATIGI